MASVEDMNLHDVLANIVARGGDYNASTALLRASGTVGRLLSFIEANTSGDLPILLLSSQLMQQALRRCPLDDLPVDVFRRLLDVLRAAANNAALGIICTQLAMSVAVLVLRSVSLSAEQVLGTLSGALQGSALLSVLTVLAEELHAPSSKISFSPQRAGEMHAALHTGAAAILAGLDDWCGGDTAVAAAAGGDQLATATIANALRCGVAWCAAGLVSADAAAASALLTCRAAACLACTTAGGGNDDLQGQAAEALCAALAATEQGSSSIGVTASAKLTPLPSESELSLLPQLANAMLGAVGSLPP